MKKEELDRLKAQFWKGNTSLEQERRLKELEEDRFFAMLREPEQKMDWDFDDFMQQVNQQEKPKGKKVVPMTRRIITITAVAAALIVGFFVIRQIVESNADKVKPVLVRTESNNQILDMEYPETNDKQGINDQDETPEINKPHLKITGVEDSTIIANKKSHQQSKESYEPAQAIEEQLYVEINGIKIYDEEKAIEVTETALQLATSNLRKGMKGVENIKYLKIKI